LVEAQHVAATMKLVDDQREQDVLEALLDASKPRLPAGTLELDYLLATPFRSPTRRYGSRFRAPADPGVFYGAESIHTASAEVGYWRWVFLKDAVELERLEPVAHTAFSASVATTAIDLRAGPFDVDTAAWVHPSDYSRTQAFARVARSASVGAIVYQSVRSPEAAWCIALLSPSAFAARKPGSRRETWYLAVSQSQVTWRSQRGSMRFSTQSWRP
jgi:hypothetical protein